MEQDLEYTMVQNFHVKFRQIVNYKPVHLTRRKLRERFVSMLEEVLEFGEACGLGILDGDGDPVAPKECKRIVCEVSDTYDYATQVDSLVDLVYFAKGTAVMMGIPWRPLFADVQVANMSKEPGLTHRGFLMDVVKPAGWQGPQTMTILGNYGYDPYMWLTDEGAHDESKCVDDPIHKKPSTEAAQ